MRTRCPAVAGIFVMVMLLAGRAAAGPDELVARSYPVADLIVPLARTAEGAKADAASATMEERLTKLIVTSIEPGSWREMGGPGTVEYYPLGMSMVITQSAAVHEKIAALLADLRKTQDVEVALEIRFLSIPVSAFFERIGIDFNENALPKTEQPMTITVYSHDKGATSEYARLTFLNEQQLRKFLEGAQGDRRSSILQAPKLTLFNGQLGAVNVTDKVKLGEGRGTAGREQFASRPESDWAEIGLRIKAQPVVAPDRRFVQLYLRVEDSELTAASPAGQAPRVTTRAFEKTIAIPRGQTAVLGGIRKEVEVRNEFGPPVLSKIPYVNRCFRKVGYDRESYSELVLVTPRVLALDESTDPLATAEATRRGYEQVQKLVPGTRYQEMAGACLKPAAAPKRPDYEAELLAPARGHSRTDVLAVLRAAYDGARADGRADEAAKLARAMLAIDPNLRLPQP